MLNLNDCLAVFSSLAIWTSPVDMISDDVRKEGVGVESDPTAVGDIRIFFNF